MPAYPVGMVLLARLAVHRLHQGEGHGALLLAEALHKAVAAGEDASRDFLLIMGSSPCPEHPMRLYRRIKNIRASLRAAG
jgi:hypothetical protein